MNIYPFDSHVMRLALVAGLAVALCAPLVGTFLVQRRMALLGEGLGHVAFAGAAAGVATGAAPLWCAFVLAVFGALVVEWLRSRGRATSDLALALMVYGGLAAGNVLLSHSSSAGSQANAYLFGSLVTASVFDVQLVVVLAALVTACVAVTGRALFAVVLDEEASRVSGLPVDALNLLLAALSAVTVVAAMRVVGAVLVAALMVLPVATSRVLARSFRTTLFGAVVAADGAVIVGLTASRVWDLAPGGSIVLASAALFVCANLTRRVFGRRR